MAVSRKQFLSLATVSSVGMLVPGKWNQSTAQQKDNQKPDPLDKELVKEFVIQGHRDLGRVQEMYTLQPGFLNVSWDWGGGDFETALEGAGHMGRKDIAQFLLDNGARLNIFCAAMLGKIEIVKSILTAMPELKNSKGPHGLKLIHHATKGGEEAAAVLGYLKSIGAS